jgi:hypothetical protein
MTQPVKFFRNTDAGAPPIYKDNPSAIIDVLRKCLVTGYGDKEPLGWTVAFDDPLTQRIAFRNDTVDGVGGYVQIKSKSGDNSTSSNYLYLTTSATMLGFDEMYNTGYTHNIPLLNKAFNWYVIGTSTGFYFHMMDAVSVDVQPVSMTDAMCYVGEIRPFIPDDASRFTMVAAGTEGAACLLHNLDSGAILCGLHDTDGTSNLPLPPYYNPSIHRLSDTTVFSGTPDTTGVPHKFSPMILYGRTDAKDRNNLSTRHSNLQPWCRGQVQGLYYSTFSGYSGMQWPVIEVYDGHSFLLVRTTRALQHWINITSWQ